MIRPRSVKFFALIASARSSKYGRSKLAMLYPMMTSGSTLFTNSAHDSNRRASSSNDRTWEPTILAHVFNVNTFRTNGFDSPGSPHVSMATIQGSEVLTLACYHIRNLNYRINPGLWEDTLTPSTLDIEAQYAQRSKLLPVVVRSVGCELVPSAMSYRQDQSLEAQTIKVHTEHQSQFDNETSCPCRSATCSCLGPLRSSSCQQPT